MRQATAVLRVHAFQESPAVSAEHPGDGHLAIAGRAAYGDHHLPFGFFSSGGGGGHVYISAVARPAFQNLAGRKIPAGALLELSMTHEGRRLSATINALASRIKRDELQFGLTLCGPDETSD